MTRRPALRGIPGLRLALTTAIVVVLVGTGTLAGHAYWTATATAPITATTAAVATTATGAADLSTGYRSGIVAVNGSGQSVVAVTGVLDKTAAVTVRNTGGAPLAYSLVVAGGTASFNRTIALQVWKQLSASCAAVPSNSALVATGTLAAPPAIVTASATLEAGTSAVFCLRTSVTSVSAAGTQTTTPSITVVGRVGANWTASSTATAFTQTEAAGAVQIKHAKNGMCLDSTSGAVEELITIRGCSTAASTNSQAFRFAPVSSAGTGVYRITSGASAGSSIPSAGAFGNNMKLIPTVADTASGGPQQQWRIVQHGAPGSFQIKNVGTGACLFFWGTSPGDVNSLGTCGTTTNVDDYGYMASHFTLTSIP